MREERGYSSDGGEEEERERMEVTIVEVATSSGEGCWSSPMGVVAGDRGRW